MTHPEICACNGQVYRPLMAYVRPENNQRTKGSHMGYVGFECVECGETVLTDEIPGRHADDDGLGMPEQADRDMVRENKSTERNTQ